jgi:hypothetical protein
MSRLRTLKHGCTAPPRLWASAILSREPITAEMASMASWVWVTAARGNGALVEPADTAPVCVHGITGQVEHTST